MKFSLKESMLRPFQGEKPVDKFFVGGLFYLAALAVHFTNAYINCFSRAYRFSENAAEAFVQGFKAGMTCTHDNTLGLFLTAVAWLIVAVPVGYAVQYLHNYLHGDEKILPDWKNNIFSYFKKGLTVYLIGLFYYLIELMAIFVITFALILSGLILGILSEGQGNTVGGILGVALHFVFLPLVPYILCMYAENFKISRAINVFALLNHVFKAFDRFFICAVVGGALYIVYIIVSAILRILVIGGPVMSFTVLPVMLVVLTLFAAAYIVAGGRDSIVKETGRPDAFDISRTL